MSTYASHLTLLHHIGIIIFYVTEIGHLISRVYSTVDLLATQKFAVHLHCQHSEIGYVLTL
jgi:hypothetical protein